MYVELNSLFSSPGPKPLVPKAPKPNINQVPIIFQHEGGGPQNTQRVKKGLEWQTDKQTAEQTLALLKLLVRAKIFGWEARRKTRGYKNIHHCIINLTCCNIIGLDLITPQSRSKLCIEPLPLPLWMWGYISDIAGTFSHWRVVSDYVCLKRVLYIQ